MLQRRPLLLAATAAAAALAFAQTAHAQGTIKIGELNSYKAQPAFLEPYKKGWELAVEEVNASGGVRRGRRQDHDRPGRLPEGARHQRGFRVRAGDRFLCRVDGARRTQGRLQGFSD